MATSGCAAAMSRRIARVVNSKVRQRHVAAHRLHRLEMRHQVCCLDDVAVHAAALLKMHQVRRRVHPVRQPACRQMASSMAQVEPLPLVPATVITGQLKAQAHALGHGAHTVQAQLDVFGVQALAVREPVVQRCGGCLHSRRIVAHTRDGGMIPP
jgi:hypothetical protein